MNNSHNREILKQREQQIADKEKAVMQSFEKNRERLSQKYPFVFTMMAAFGLVATFYGLERIIDGIDLLANNPIIMLLTGIVALVITGQLYKRLG